MNADSIPSDLLHFLDAHVDSVEQLEILRLVGERPDRPWAALELATAAQATAASIAALEQRGFLKTESVNSTILCGFAPMPPEMENLLGRLLRLYRERPVTLIRLLYSRDRSGLKAFAEAFRLKKEN